MRCPECKCRCPAKAVSCEQCGAALAQPRHASSTLGNMAGLVCLAVVLFKFFVPASADRDSPTQPYPPRPTAWPAGPTPNGATNRSQGPTLNGVPYDRSPLVQKLDLTQPAPPPPRR